MQRFRHLFMIVLGGIAVFSLAACQLTIQPPTTPVADQTSPLRNELLSRADLVGFRRAYLKAFGALERDHPPIEVIHLIPAVPIPIALMCGHDVLNKAHPALLIYDLDKVNGGYTPTLTINRR